MGKRRLAREYCLQALYLADIGGFGQEEVFSALEAVSPDVDAETAEFARVLVGGTLSNLIRIDEIIQEYAKNWKLTRMSNVDRCILRLGAYEIVVSAQVPTAAAIDEAIELAKKYSTENSGRFINGILDRLKEKRSAQNSPQ